ncbi:uncharacterized protein SPPG_04095 [Spizellomyces punctatus DAOM BR117]|uniref:Glycosyltransferase family 92 protein n=1 Tax=Spizellomyces punctatus (strain DAOM BR117) TaxID=645134 RepID=A0A0L0HJI4_SPIPD|nr:uncharacterized protein SPPG_04095 [Spizellomyces punctatus DAOM BR117]KND00999.1 hypothetical protein SPPG_04095 [Spizellomyces punctatus DAOM BR117]|eukprot:XP_016609038.1 hypothetical protein SPPG_04095 [Spizellomyces punctatus DAOM BR117]
MLLGGVSRRLKRTAPHSRTLFYGCFPAFLTVTVLLLTFVTFSPSVRRRVSELTPEWLQKGSHLLPFHSGDSEEVNDEFTHPILITKEDTPEPYIVVATMIANQAHYLPEWIEFHLLQGVERFVIYHDSRKKTKDLSRQVAEPYIQSGIIEWIEWPQDAHNIEKVLGARQWPVEWAKREFYDQLENDCIKHNPARTSHLQAGCQAVAFIDAAARYRNRSRWVGAWDVDEFVFIPQEDTEGDVLGDHTLKNVLTKLEWWDQIWLNGRIFATNGYFSDPTPPSDGLPFTLVTERYEYRFDNDLNRQFDRSDIKGFDWTRKALVDPKIVTSNKIHGWLVEIPASENREERLMQTNFKDIVMYHYQFRSVLGNHDKAVANGNPAMEYLPVREVYFNEKKDTGILFMVPFVKEQLMKRITAGWWKGWEPPSAVARPFLGYQKAKQPQVCLAFAYLDPNLSKLRKSISSIFHHLRTYEPSLSFEAVLILPRSTYDKRLMDEFPFETLRFLNDTTSKAQAVDLLFEACTAPYILSLVDDYETRVGWLNPLRPEVVNRTERTVKAPIISAAVQLLEQRYDLLEVWIGDVPDIAVYNQNRTDWLPFTPSKNGKIDADYGAVKWYRVQSASATSVLGVSRFGGTLKHRERIISVGPVFPGQTGGNKLTETVDEYALQEDFAKRAAALGFSSAHFCLGEEPTSRQDQCNFDPDATYDGATTGLMWRIRPVDEDDRAKDGMIDRAL